MKFPIGLLGKKHYIESRNNTFLTIGPWKKKLFSEIHYKKNVVSRVKIQRSIVRKKGLQKKRVISRKTL